VNEKTPLLLASASIVGIIVISLISEQISLDFTDMREISAKMLNEVVHVRGVVREFKEFSAGYKMLIEQDGFKVGVVYFTNDKTKAVKGMCADVIGEVKTKDGALEIEAKSAMLFIC